MKEKFGYSARLLFRYDTGGYDYIFPLCEFRRVYVRLSEEEDPVEYFKDIGYEYETDSIRFVAVLEIQLTDENISASEGPFWKYSFFCTLFSKATKKESKLSALTGDDAADMHCVGSNLNTHYVELAFGVFPNLFFIKRVRILNFILPASLSFKKAIEKCNEIGMKHQTRWVKYLGIHELLNGDLFFGEDEDLGCLDFWYKMRHIPAFLLPVIRRRAERRINSRNMARKLRKCRKHRRKNTRIEK